MHFQAEAELTELNLFCFVSGEPLCLSASGGIQQSTGTGKGGDGNNHVLVVALEHNSEAVLPQTTVVVTRAGHHTNAALNFRAVGRTFSGDV